MQIEIPSFGQANAVLRHVYSSAGTAVAVLAIFAGLTPEQQAALLNAIHQITDGATSILAGLGTLVPIVSAVYAAWSGRSKALVTAVASMPDVTRIEVKDTAKNGVAAALNDPKLDKVVPEGEHT